MNEYFVAGGVYKNLKGEEDFNLVRTGPGKPPYVMVNSVMGYFRLAWHNAHLYRVEDDYSLSLVAPSREALQWGLKAPERVWLEASLLEKLQAVIKQGTPSDTPEDPYILGPRRKKLGFGIEYNCYVSKSKQN